MAWVEALFRINPSVGWTLVACALFAAELASAKLRFAWSALAALAPALANVAGIALEREAEIALFLGLTAVSMAVFARERRLVRARARRQPAWHGLPTPLPGPLDPNLLRLKPRPATAASRQFAGLLLHDARRTRSAALTAPAGDPRRAGGLVGETAQSLTEFSNGVGRIWLAGAEWGAELVQGETLAPDTRVEVLGVSGGVRLQVRPV